MSVGGVEWAYGDEGLTSIPLMSQISLILSSESRITRIKGLLGFILSRLNEMCYWSMISCYLIAILFRQH